MRIVKLNENGSIEIKYIEKGLEPLQAEVQGYIQYLPVTDNIVAYCNEDGKLNGMKPNPLATKFAHAFIGTSPYDVIVGPLILVGTDDEGESTDVSLIPVVTMIEAVC